MIINGYTLPLAPALTTPSTDIVFHTYFARPSMPNADGYKEFVAGVRTVRVLPFSTGLPGQVFQFRLVGWSEIGAGQNQVVWLGLVLAQLSCTIGQITGPDEGAYPQTAPLQRALRMDQRLCNNLEVVSGTPLICNGPVAQACIDGSGYRVLSFEFASDDQLYKNAFWTLA